MLLFKNRAKVLRCWALLFVAVFATAMPAQTPKEDLTRQIVDLELSRSASVDDWRNLVSDSRDPKLLCRAILALGRVGEPQLVPLSREWMGRLDQPMPQASAEQLAVGVGLLGDEELFGLLVGKVHVPDLARAVALLGDLPKLEDLRTRVWDALHAIADHGQEATADRGLLVDPFAARWIYGTRIKEPVYHEEVRAPLMKNTTPERLRAALYYLMRHPKRPSNDVIKLLAGHLFASDPLVAAYAARAMARCEGAGEEEALVLGLAVEQGGDRYQQVERLRALGMLEVAPPGSALLSALASDDWSVRRTALEVLARRGGLLDSDDREGLTAFVVAMIRRDPAMDVRRTAVLALETLSRRNLDEEATSLGLGAPWPVRAAMGEVAGQRGALGLTEGLQCMNDPDRRVRQSWLEGVGQSVADDAVWTVSLRNRIWSALGGSQVGAGPLGSSWSAAGLRDFGDPVVNSLVCRVLEKDLKRDNRKTEWEGLGTWLDKISTSTPLGETEPFQAFVDLAACLGSNEARKTWALARTHPQAAIRKQAALAAERIEGEAKAHEGPEHQFDLASGLKRVGLAEADWKSQIQVRVATNKGVLELLLFADEAPHAVLNFLSLAKAGAYDGILFHRVVPGFVAQAGCNRGDGWGSPGYTIPCEIGPRTYRRGTLGMALAGKDTGGSQWFLCHEPQPHLDMRYTIFGELTQGFEVLDALVPGDVIKSVKF